MINFLPLKWQHYARLKLERGQALKLFVWFLALIPAVVFNSRDLPHLYFQDLGYFLAFLAGLVCFFSSCLRDAFLGSIRHHIKTFQGRFIGVVFLFFLPSIIFSAWPGAGVRQLVLFILTLLLLTGLAGIIPLMEDKHRRLFREIMVLSLIISLLVFSLLYHPYYKRLPALEGYWATLQKLYHLRYPLWLTKSVTEHLVLFFPTLLFALWYSLPRRPFVFSLFFFLAILLLCYGNSRTAIAGLFANMCILAMGVFFLPSLSAQHKIYGLSLFLLAVMIPAPIVLERDIRYQKEYNKKYAVSEGQVTEIKPTPLGIPVSVIDIERQIIWIEYIRGWKEKPFLGHGIDSTKHYKTVVLTINNRVSLLYNEFRKANKIRGNRRNPHRKNFSSPTYRYPNYFLEFFMKAGLISPHKLKLLKKRKKPRLNHFIHYYPHNYYLQILFEAGLIGFIPFMAFLIFLFSRSMLIFWHSREVGALLILGLHASFFTKGFFNISVFSEKGLIMYGTAWMVILVLSRQPDRIEQEPR